MFSLVRLAEELLEKKQQWRFVGEIVNRSHLKGLEMRCYNKAASG
jgi:hypothetical protein